MTEPILVHDKTGKPVKVGDKLVSRGERFIVTGWELPRHAGSSGRVNVKSVKAGWSQQYFPHVFDLSFTNRSDR